MLCRAPSGGRGTGFGIGYADGRLSVHVGALNRGSRRREVVVRDPEVYNYVRQVLRSMREHDTGLRQALAMHGNNMTTAEVREIIAEERARHRSYHRIPGELDEDGWEL